MFQTLVYAANEKPTGPIKDLGPIPGEYMKISNLLLCTILILAVSNLSATADEKEVATISLRAEETIISTRENRLSIKRNYTKSQAGSEQSTDGYILGQLFTETHQSIVCDFVRTTHCRGDCYEDGFRYLVGSETVYFSAVDHDLGHHAADGDYIASLYDKKLGTHVPVVLNEKDEVVATGRSEIIRSLRNIFDEQMEMKNLVPFCKRLSRSSESAYRACLVSEKKSLLAKKAACSE